VRSPEGDLEANLYGVGDGGEPRKGVLEQAEGGTLYVNGLEDLSTAAQRLLLAAIDTGSYLRKSGTAPLRLDARIISSAQPGFETRGAEPFRIDLLSHLNVLELRVPPLREYAEDVPELLRYYVDRSSTRSDSRSGASASRRRTGSATIPGRAISASSRTSCIAC
jgi:DNA-binding NtrC family response regulator